jgi:glycerol-3-phosphate dehydrogenase
MAERAVELAGRRLSERFGIEPGAARTNNIAVSGGGLNRRELATIARRLVESEKLTAAVAEHLVHGYGSNHQQLIGLTREDERLRSPLVKGLPQLCAEIVYAARSEMAVTLSDALARRTRLSILAGEESVKSAPVAAELMAKELGWNEEEVKSQVESYLAEYNKEYRARVEPGEE